MNEIDNIWGTFDRLSSLTHLADQRRNKLAQIRSLEVKKCGNCDHWMKSSCIPEKVHRQFKGCDSPGCTAFTASTHNQDMLIQRKIELKELETKL